MICIFCCCYFSSIRKVSNVCITHSREYERALSTQIIMLAPLAPQFASELWAGFCSTPYHLADDDTNIQKDRDVLDQNWPEIDMDYKMNLDVLVSFGKRHIYLFRRGISYPK